MAKKTNRTNDYESKTNESATLDMSNAQEQYVAHWLVRFTGDFVADAIATSNQDSALKDVRTKDEFLNAVTQALNSTFGCSLVAHEYDFGAKKSRSDVIAKLEQKKQKAQADTTSVRDFSKALKAWKSKFNHAFEQFEKQNNTTLSVEQKRQNVERHQEAFKTYGLTLNDVLVALKLKDDESDTLEIVI